MKTMKDTNTTITTSIEGVTSIDQLIKIDRNGTKYWSVQTTCPRCMGRGIFYVGVHNGSLVPAQPDSGVCYRCNGTGKVDGTVKEYTAEHRAKLDEQKAKRDAKREAEKAEREAKWAEEKAKREKEREEREAKWKEQEEARKAKSQHVGKIGDRITAVVTFNFSASYRVKSFTGFGETEMNIYNMTDDNGNTLVWKTSTALGIDVQNDEGKTIWMIPEKGDRISLKATIKEHNEYKGEKQTILTRVKVLNITEKEEA